MISERGREARLEDYPAHQLAQPVLRKAARINANSEPAVFSRALDGTRGPMAPISRSLRPLLGSEPDPRLRRADKLIMALQEQLRAQPVLP